MVGAGVVVGQDVLLLQLTEEKGAGDGVGGDEGTQTHVAEGEGDHHLQPPHQPAAPVLSHLHPPGGTRVTNVLRNSFIFRVKETAQRFKQRKGKRKQKSPLLQIIMII